jgi:hypothetical protein
MGCGGSKQQAQDINNLQNLAPRALPNGGFPLEPELSGSQLTQALTWVAQYISQHSRKPITIIAVGGAVNTISLQSRQSTHDVDWFNNSLSPDQDKLLRQAANYALQQAKRHGFNIASNWFNNKTMLFIPPNLRSRLLAESVEQNYTVFSAPGLRIIAAPWSYACLTKLDRMAGGGGKSYDPEDAANYLHQYLLYKRRPHIPISLIQQAAREYQTRLKVDDVWLINRVYQRKFGRPSIVAG